VPTLDDTRLGRHRQFDWLVGTNVRTLRINLGVTQADLAALADMDPTQLSRVENGERSLKFRESIAIAHHLGVRPERLTRVFD
jgi:transcriptional regulator with XRE-family HTH domain